MNRVTSPPGRSIRLAAALGVAVSVVAGALSARAATAPAGTSASPSPISVNTVNWSGNAGSGSRAPAWFKDNSGVIHLQGAATQTNPSGSRANVVGTLPRAARPASKLYFIVRCVAGRFAISQRQGCGQA